MISLTSDVVHYIHKDHLKYPNPVCGHIGNASSENPEEVTCKMCQIVFNSPNFLKKIYKIKKIKKMR